MNIRTCILSVILAVFSCVPARAQSAGEVVTLQTLGIEGGALLYNTYCLVGAMHDGHAVNAWQKDFTIAMLDEQIDLMDTLSIRYAHLLGAQYLHADDSATVAGIKTCMEQLRSEAFYLKNYVSEETAESHLLYDDARERAWDMLKNLLGLSDGGTSCAGQATRSENR